MEGFFQLLARSDNFCALKAGESFVGPLLSVGRNTEAKEFYQVSIVKPNFDLTNGYIS